MSYVSFAGLTVSIEQLLSLGEYRIEAHARQLAAMLVDGAREYGWEPFHDVHGVAASPHIISLGHGRKRDRKSTRLNSSHGYISYAVFCLKKKKKEYYIICVQDSEKACNTE